MMKTVQAMIVLIFTLIAAGCSTPASIYGLAADERSMTAIAADTAISAAIQETILKESDMKVLDISAYCFNGNAYLVGEYDKEVQKEKAVRIAKNTNGVKHVEARLFPKKQNDAAG